MMTDVLGILEEHGADSFPVRTSGGQLVVIPRERALAGKVVPPEPPRRRLRLASPAGIDHRGHRARHLGG
jgi:hypothetical protein